VPAFPDWLPQVSAPGWDWERPHLRAIQAALQRVTAGELKRLMIFCPPRHGKSELATIRYPVWRLEREPSLRVVVGCYNQTFANHFGRRSRRLAESRSLMGPDRKAAAEWETHGGGSYLSSGVGTVPMGRGANLIVMDDPVKNREEAESPAYRERVWDWYGDLYTRQEPDCAIVLIQTRWHEDDLAGRILVAQAEGGERWEVLNLPALALANDPLGRQPGEALWPARYDAEKLEVTRATLGGYVFEALYQGNPTPREGAFFKVGRFQYCDVGDLPAKRRRVRSWDHAATEGGGDYTAGLLMSRSDDGRYFIEHVRRGQWSVGARNDEIVATAGQDGREVQITGPQDPGSAGVEAAGAFSRMLAGYRVRTVRVTGPKEIRAEPFAAQVEAGNVWIVSGGAWVPAFIEECRTFPNGTHDDQIDAASDAFTALTHRAGYIPGVALGAPRGAV
jgi:predicted phage terminase large subunit-like protein